MSSNSVTLTAREHVFPLFVKYVSANVLGMIGYSCYILADTFFVARGIGSDAIAALNLVLPVFSLLNGTGLMIGMGAAARYSLSSGRADSEIHRTIFTQALQLAFVAMLFFFSIGLFFARPLCVLLGADGTTLPHAIPYIRILLMFSPLFLCNNLLNCFVRNDGEPRLSMTARWKSDKYCAGLHFHLSYAAWHDRSCTGYCNRSTGWNEYSVHAFLEKEESVSSGKNKDTSKNCCRYLPAWSFFSCR